MKRQINLLLITKIHVIIFFNKRTYSVNFKSFIFIFTGQNTLRINKSMLSHKICYSSLVIVCQCHVILWKAWYWDSWPQWLSFSFSDQEKLNDTVCTLVEKYYLLDFSDEEKINLAIQLRHFLFDDRQSSNLKNLSIIQQLW